MSEERTCKQCQAQFTVEDEDLAFYKKISPTFAGRTFEVPAPTLCPNCRNRRRLATRNVKNLHKRKCDLCGREVVSMYSSEKTDIRVYCAKCWWSDKWDPSDYAQEYDPERSFFDQITELKKKVPAPALLHVNSENSDFVNFSNNNKNSYLIFLAGNNEDTYYGFWCEYNKLCVDVSYVTHSESCYELSDSDNCYRVFWGNNNDECKESYFIEDCKQCSDCILCSGLRNKQYFFENKQLSQGEYELKKKSFLLDLENNIGKYKRKFREIILSRPKRFALINKAEGCTGDYLYSSKSCKSSFNLFNCENCKFAYEVRDSKDFYDVTGFGIPIEKVYESQNIGLGSFGCAFISFAYQLLNSYYCEHCYYSSDLFGCVGVRNHRQYYILNKKYSKEEYESLAAEITKKMIADGEWGEFFPGHFTAFGYNETLAFDHYPLNRDKAEEIGYSWQSDKQDASFSGGQHYEPKPIGAYRADDSERHNILKGVLRCAQTGRPYKVTPHELSFYLKNNLPIPRIHWEVRMQARFQQRRKYALHHRRCMCEEGDHGHEGRCATTFETTYSPDRPERVYCESCYQKSTI